MATQKVCDECGAVGDETEVSRRAIFFSKVDDHVHIHLDVSSDVERCNKCMANAIEGLCSFLAGETDVLDKDVAYAVSRVQPR